MRTNSMVKRFAKLRIIDMEVTKSATALANEAKLNQGRCGSAWFPKLASPSHSSPCRSNQRQL